MQEPNSPDRAPNAPAIVADDVQTALLRYIAVQVLDGKDIGLDTTTPLLEWGVINSLEIVKLISFIRTQFGVSVPSSKVTAEYFQNLGALTSLVVQLAA